MMLGGCFASVRSIDEDAPGLDEDRREACRIEARGLVLEEFVTNIKA